MVLSPPYICSTGRAIMTCSTQTKLHHAQIPTIFLVNLKNISIERNRQQQQQKQKINSLFAMLIQSKLKGRESEKEKSVSQVFLCDLTIFQLET